MSAIDSISSNKKPEGRPEDTGIRLNKYLASCGICSRRDADLLIDSGRVTVNGNKALTGMKITDKDRVTVDGKPVKADRKAVLAYYKPRGVTCSFRDDHADQVITDLVDYPVRLTYAGRLDRDSEGLILLTNDGDLIERMMRGSNGHEKEYLVRIKDEVTDDFIKKMSSGIFLPEVNIKTKPCRVEKIGKRSFRIVLTQGVNRQIRRMVRELNSYVNSIKRVRVVNIELADLKPGQYREIRGNELQVLYNTVYHEKK